MVTPGLFWYSLALLVGMSGYAALHHLLLAVRRGSDRTSWWFAILAAILSFHGLMRLLHDQSPDRSVHLATLWWQWLSELMAVPAYMAFLSEIAGRRFRLLFWGLMVPVVGLGILHVVHAEGFGITFYGPLRIVDYSWGEQVYALDQNLSWGYWIFASLAIGVNVFAAGLGVHLAKNRHDITTYCLAATTWIVLLTVVLAVLNDVDVVDIPLLIDHAFVLLVAVMGLSLGDQVVRLSALESDLATSRQQLSATLDNLSDAVVATLGDGRICLWNPAAARLFGISVRKAIGDRPASFIALFENEGGRAVDPWDPACSEDSWLALRFSDDRIIEARASKLGDGGKEGVVVLLRDVTDIQRERTANEHAKRMESIGQLAGGVAHDFNNLLAAIVGSADLAKMERPPAVIGEHIDVIVTAAEQARTLSAQLLSFSRKTLSTPTLFDVHAAVGDAVGLLRRSLDPRITIITDLQAMSRHVLGDRRQFANALLNLGINARDAMPEGGVLTIASHDVEMTSADDLGGAQPLQPGPHVELVVTDSGSGISPTVLPHIFEPYFTTKSSRGGTGLGLAAVYGCVGEHRGRIQATSVMGGGTTFRLLLPCRIQTAEDAVEVHSERKPTSNERVIMVIDDDHIVRPITCGLVRALGYQAVACSDGDSALSALNKGPVDLILLDAIMPKENGLSVMRRIRAAGFAVPILLCSGYSEGDDVAAMRDLDLAGIVRKPFRYEELGRVCGRLLPPKT